MNLEAPRSNLSPGWRFLICRCPPFRTARICNFRPDFRDWRRRPDLNRGWRFCRPKQAPPNRPETANSLAFLPPVTARIRLNPPQKGSATGSAVFSAIIKVGRGKWDLKHRPLGPEPEAHS